MLFPHTVLAVSRKRLLGSRPGRGSPPQALIVNRHRASATGLPLPGMRNATTDALQGSPRSSIRRANFVNGGDPPAPYLAYDTALALSIRAKPPTNMRQVWHCPYDKFGIATSLASHLRTYEPSLGIVHPSQAKFVTEMDTPPTKGLALRSATPSS